MKDNEIKNKTLPIKFTEGALKEIKRLAKQEYADKVLYLGVKSGGCSGYSYVFEFVQRQDEHILYSLEDISVAIKDDDLRLIKNMEVDYEDGLNNRGFTFNNPNSSETCGCGTSFA